jgi:hypothetical protein
MKISSYFALLRSSYEAEINDMAFDSEGKNVLRQRLAQRRKELPFLRQMMASAPEMVAIVFHQGMRFSKPALMDALVAKDSSQLPDWAALSVHVSLEPWAVGLAEELCKDPAGDTLMVLGRDKGPDGHFIPGAKIQQTVDLIARGLAWHTGISRTPEFHAAVNEVKDLFAHL